MYREIIAVCSEIHAKHINTAVWAESRIFECQKRLYTFSTLGFESLNHIYGFLNPVITV